MNIQQCFFIGWPLLTAYFAVSSFLWLCDHSVSDKSHDSNEEEDEDSFHEDAPSGLMKESVNIGGMV